MTKTAKKEEAGQQPTSPVLAEIELSRIESNPWQPRATQPTEDELAELLNSIKAVGQKMPILVRPNPEKEGRFQIGDGAMRKLVAGKLGRKTITAMVQPLTDRQMKILALAANTFVRLQDSDKETAIYKLWESEYKTEEEGRPGVRKDTVFTGLREMERETGFSHAMINAYLNSYVTRHAIMREAPKDVQAAVKQIKTRDLAQIAEIAKESPQIAREIVMARTDSKAPLKSSEIKDVVAATKMVATPAEKAQVAQEIIQTLRTAQKEREKIDQHARESIAPLVLSHEEKRAEKTVADRAKLDADQKRKEDEIKKAVNLDNQLRMRCFDIESQAALINSDVYYRRIANIRNETTKFKAIESIRKAAQALSEFAARFKEA